MFFEPDRIYRSMKSEVVDDGVGLPLDVCFTPETGSGSDRGRLGACIQEVMRAATLLAEQDIQCEVLDLATIKPLDMETILASVRKTGRLLVVHEACGSFGVGAEIVARVTEEALTALKALAQTPHRGGCCRALLSQRGVLPHHRAGRSPMRLAS